jgi:hypothetical protein
MTEFSIEDQIEDYLDTIFILFHSQSSVDGYRFAIGWLENLFKTNMKNL